MLIIVPSRLGQNVRNLHTAIAALTPVESRVTRGHVKGAERNYILNEKGEVTGAIDIPQQVVIHPSLNLTMADFPDNFQFGNGVTYNATVGLKTGVVMNLTWAVTEQDQDLVTRGKLAAIMTILSEGG